MSAFEYLKEIFNNRELATLIWLLVFLTLINFSRENRESIKKILNLIFSKQLLTIWLLVALHISLAAYLLHFIGLWEISELKDTIIWVLLVAPATIFTFYKEKDNKKYFKNSLLENFRFSLIVEFLSGLYVFSFIAEFVLLPTITFLSVLLIFAKREEKYKPVQTLLEVILFCVGLILIYHTISQIIIQVKTLATIDTLRSFILPPIFAIWFIPFLYCLSLYTAYEDAYIRVNAALSKTGILRFAKKRALLLFNINVEGLKRWSTLIFRIEIDSKEKVNESISSIKRAQRSERNPPKISLNKGWSPYKAKEFLSNVGIDTGYYENSYENEWFAISKYTNLDNEIVGNNISYSVSGDNFIAKKLCLSLRIHAPSLSENAIEKFLEYAKELFRKAVQSELPSNLILAIRKKETKSQFIKNIQISIKIENWENIESGYGLNLILQVKN